MNEAEAVGSAQARQPWSYAPPTIGSRPSCRLNCDAATFSHVTMSTLRFVFVHATNSGTAAGRTSSADGSIGVGAGDVETSTESDDLQPVARSVMVRT